MRVRIRRARRLGDPAVELAARRRGLPWVAFRHLAFSVALLSGAALMWRQGWGLAQPRWLGLKLGLVAFLLLPLEAMHAWIWHGWIAPGLRQTPAPPFAKDLARGVAMDDMLAALAAPLLVLALPLVVWLSLARPF